MSEILIYTKTQRLIIDPPTRTVSIMAVGPVGPPGRNGRDTELRAVVEQQRAIIDSLLIRVEALEEG